MAEKLKEEKKEVLIEEIRGLLFKDKVKKYFKVNEEIKKSIKEFISKWNDIDRMTQYGVVAFTPDETEAAFLFDLTTIYEVSGLDPIFVKDLNSEDGRTRFRTNFACKFLNFGLPEHNLTLGVTPFPKTFYTDLYNLLILCVPGDVENLSFNFFAEKKDKEIDNNYYWCRGYFTSEGIDWKIKKMI